MARISASAGLLGGTVRPEDRARRPFRAPHHSISSAGMFGSSRFRPGEATLAHGGVLFLDEVVEFARAVTEQVRYALGRKQVGLVRASEIVHLPADFWLIAASLPCACGWLGHPTHKCQCTPETRERFDARLARAVPKDHVRIELSMTSVVMLTTSEPGKTTKQWRDGAKENDHG